jgi:hypothetical protein
MKTALATGGNHASTCTRASNIVLFTGQDLTNNELAGISTIPFSQNGINLWIVHPGNVLITGNAEGSMLNTNLYTAACFQETASMGKTNLANTNNGFLLPMTSPHLANVFFSVL